MNSRQRIVSNVLIMGVGQIATFGLSLAYTVLVSRYLGPTRFGALMLAKSIVVVLWVAAQLGMTTLITRSVARNPNDAGRLVSAAMIARTGLAIPALAAIYIYTHVVHLDPETSLAAYMYGAAEVLWSLQLVLLAVFQGREQMSLNALWTIGTRALGLGLGLVIKWLHGGVVGFAAADIPAAFLLLVVTLHWMRSFGTLTWRVSRSDLREVTVGGLAFWANDLVLNFYLYVDTVILASLAGTRAVGIYRPGTQLFNVAMFLTSIIGPATLPLFSRLGIDASTDFRRAGRQTLSYFIVCAVPLTLGLATFANPLILRIYGSDYRLSVPILVVLSLSILPTFLNFQFAQMLIASDRQWRWTAIMAAGCVVNPLFNVVLVPLAIHQWHNGALGAAVAWCATEVVMCIYGVIILRDVVLERSIGRVVIGSLIAGAGQGAVLWVTAALWPPLSETLGVAAYTVVVLAVGALPREDALLLLETALRQLRVRRVNPGPT